MDLDIYLVLNYRVYLASRNPLESLAEYAR